ncbi:MAG: conjugal transfer protein TraX [Clostridia bacterium]|nr:conjugal transfer protein TraX [Clostridia bacterium]
MLQEIQNPNTKILSAFQIKVIALVCMTLDHLAAFGFEVPTVERYSSVLHTVGRIAAPLFLFVLVQSVQHTRSRMKLLLRLYIAGMCVGLFDTAINFFFGEIFGYTTPGNIIFTFFYVVLYIILLEWMIFSYKNKNLRSFVSAFFIFLLSFFPSIFFNAINSVVPSGTTIAHQFLFQGLKTSLIPSFYDVDYGIGFIVLGVLLYFANTKRRQCITFAIFCLFCISGVFAVKLFPTISYISLYRFTSTFFDPLQCRMIYALPFMMLYNGERGRKCKWFFYWYYPLHRQLIFIVSALVT